MFWHGSGKPRVRAWHLATLTPPAAFGPAIPKPSVVLVRSRAPGVFWHVSGVCVCVCVNVLVCSCVVVVRLAARGARRFLAWTPAPFGSRVPSRPFAVSSGFRVLSRVLGVFWRLAGFLVSFVLIRVNLCETLLNIAKSWYPFLYLAKPC